MTDLHEVYEESGHTERRERVIGECWEKYGPDAAAALMRIADADRHGTLSATPAISFIDWNVELGEGTKVWHFAVVLADVKIGVNCSIGARAEIGRGTTIGDESRIGSGVFLPPNSRIGKNVFVGPGVICTDDRYPKVPYPGDLPYTAEPPTIEDGASIGAGAVLLPGVRIGAGAIVGAGSVVTRNVDANTMVRGEPARVKAVMGLVA